MNKRDGLKVDSFIETNKILTLNVTRYETNVVTKQQATSFSTLLTSLLGFLEKMNQPTAWLTGEKNKAKGLVVSQLYPFTNALVCLGNSLSDTLILEIVDISDSALRRLSEIKLIAFTKQIIDLSRVNLTGLVPYSITEVEVDELETTLAAFVQKRTDHKLLIKEKKVSAKDFIGIKQQINQLLNKKLDPSIDNLRATEPVFVSQYFTVRQVSKVVHHIYDVLGYITDAHTNAPVAYGSLHIKLLNTNTTISNRCISIGLYHRCPY